MPAERVILRTEAPATPVHLRADEGVGLGLPLARGLTEAMGGTLDVHSKSDEGTTVTVVLPLMGSADE